MYRSSGKWSVPRATVYFKTTSTQPRPAANAMTSTAARRRATSSKTMPAVAYTIASKNAPAAQRKS
jgi:hypothetical protein